MMQATFVSSDAPRLREITGAQCEDLLLRNAVGRLAFPYQGRVNVIPVHYAYEDGWIYGRTSPGSKLRQILRDRRVAFEVDEYSGFFDWSSAVVQGTFYVLNPGSASGIYEHALQVLRKVFPDTFTHADPVPFRTELFRISMTSVTGRSASPEGGFVIEAEEPHVIDPAVAEEDRRLRNQIIATLGRVPDARPENVAVDVMAGLVVLTGVVETFADIAPIERAVISVPDVRVVLNQIEIGFTREFHTEPIDLGNAALASLRSCGSQAANNVHVLIETGWLRVEGAVSSEGEHQAFIRHLRQVRGARGIVDRIKTLS